METGGLLEKMHRINLKCMSPECRAQRERTKHAGSLSTRYQTHVYCKDCATYWDRDPSRKGKKQNCSCCNTFCREGPIHGTNGAATYARKRAARIANGEHIRIRKSSKSEVRSDPNMFGNFDLDIDTSTAGVAARYSFDPQIMSQDRKHKSV